MKEADHFESLNAVLTRPSVAKILGMLNSDGEQARLIGGAVRNSLRHLPVLDIDIATTALPDVVIARALQAGMHVVPTGIDHGTVTLIINSVAHEITTLREDIETDGRHAKVRFGRNFEIDALRRDFTINALSATPDGHICDYAGGIADLEARRVRFIGNPDQRIREDFLRILRFFRFSAWYSNGNLDADGLAAVIRNHAGLNELSRERVRAEFFKLLAAPDAIPVLRVMSQIRVLDHVLGGPSNIPRYEHLRPLEQGTGIPPDILRHLHALAIEQKTDLERVKNALRLTNREYARIDTALSYCRVNQTLQESELKPLLYRLGRESYRDVLLLHAARTGDDVRPAISLAERWQPPKFIPTGKHVLALGVEKGPDVSAILNAAEEAWLSYGLPADASAQFQILEATVMHHPAANTRH